MTQQASITGYRYDGPNTTCAHAYLLPAVRSELARLLPQIKTESGQPKLFDVGCGNGSVASILSLDGWDVTGVDPSSEGIAQAKQNFPDIKLFQGSAYDDLVAEYGQFPVAVSLEVVEHVYAPRDYARTLFALLESGGTAIVSTPYHGYLKNVALAVSGKWTAISQLCGTMDTSSSGLVKLLLLCFRRWASSNRGFCEWEECRLWPNP